MRLLLLRLFPRFDGQHETECAERLQGQTELGSLFSPFELSAPIAARSDLLCKVGLGQAGVTPGFPNDGTEVLCGNEFHGSMWTIAHTRPGGIAAFETV